MLVGVSTFGQDATKRYRLKCDWFKNVKLDNVGHYLGSSDWKDTSFLIVLDLPEKKFALYSPSGEVYDIISEPKKIMDEDNSYIQWSLLDKTGGKCRFRYVLPNKDELDKSGYFNLYIDYKNWVLVYRVKLD
jgi:hypothetical protein